MSDRDANRGLYGKYRVERVDGSSGPGGKHEGCDYFVLDLTHDHHAKAALKAYADSCRADYPLLAADLDDALAAADTVTELNLTCARLAEAERLLNRYLTTGVLGIPEVVADTQKFLRAASSASVTTGESNAS